MQCISAFLENHNFSMTFAINFDNECIGLYELHCINIQEDTQLAQSEIPRWAHTVSLLWGFREFATHTVSSLLTLHGECIRMISRIAHSKLIVWVILWVHCYVTECKGSIMPYPNYPMIPLAGYMPPSHIKFFWLQWPPTSTSHLQIKGPNVVMLQSLIVPTALSVIRKKKDIDNQNVILSYT